MRLDPIAHVILYAIFLLCWVLLGEMLNFNFARGVSQASVLGFKTVPYMQHPTKTLRDIRGGAEVYEWLTNVVLNQIYAGDAEVGSKQFCTPSFPCKLEEGEAPSDAFCSQNLQAGEVNCPSFMGTRDCCEACSGDKCPLFNLPTDEGLFSNATWVDDISANCDQSMQTWMNNITEWGWIPEDTGSTWVDDMPRTSKSAEFRFCPERQPAAIVEDVGAAQDLAKFKVTNRPLYMHRFNRVLLGRLSMKRMKLVESTSASFKNAYRMVPAAHSGRVSTFSSDKEDTELLGTCNECSYKRDSGFMKAGGYVKILSFEALTHDEVRSQLADLRKVGWFDQTQGSFVLELLLWNSNLQMFMWVYVTIEHDMYGTSNSELLLVTLDPTLTERPSLVVLYVVIVSLYLLFLSLEFDSMATSIVEFCTASTFLRLVPIVLSTICGITYLTIVVSFKYKSIRYSYQDIDVKRFEDVAELSRSMDAFMTSLSINIFVVIVRLLNLMRELSANTYRNALMELFRHLVAFFAVYLILLASFISCGFILFGITMREYSNVRGAFLTSIKAVMSESLYENMYSARLGAGTCYYVCFNMGFLIAKQPVFSIIISGYHMLRLEVQERRGDEHVKSSWSRLKVGFKMLSDLFFNCFNTFSFGVANAIAAKGDTRGEARINSEQVGLLRDIRRTQPRWRHVVYDDKGSDFAYNEGNKPCKDITLVAKKPVFRNGMMQYVVTNVTDEGAATDALVTKGFRLIGIKSGDMQTMDRDEFRNYNKFYSQGEYEGNDEDGQPKGYNGDPQNILADLKRPISLDLEGSVRFWSIECCFLIITAVVVICLCMLTNGTEKACNLFKTYSDLLEGPKWVTHAPQRVVDINSLSNEADYLTWISKVIVDEVYECSVERDASRHEVSTCHTHEPFTKRNLWYPYARGDDVLLRYNSRQVDTYTQPPAAANGLSFGFLPGKDLGKVPVETVVRKNSDNSGVMRNNQVRMTIQFLCSDAIDEGAGCARRPCMRRAIEKGGTCHTGGKARDPRKLLGSFSGIEYTFTDEGSYRENGGVTIGFGATHEEALYTFQVIEDDEIMLMDPVSIVVEFVFHNANVRSFVYSAVELDIAPSGYMRITTIQNAFTLEDWMVFAYPTNSRYLLWILLVVSCLYFTLHLIYDIIVQLLITKAMQRSLAWSLVDYFLEDPFNVIEAISTFMNWFTLYAWIRFHQPDSLRSDLWTRGFEYEVRSDGPDDFQRFFRAQEWAATFRTGFASAGSLMCFRVIKYFRIVGPLRLILRTLGVTSFSLITIIMVYVITLYCMAVIFRQRWAMTFPVFNDLGETFDELFLYSSGVFHTKELEAHSPVFFTIVFTVFEVIMLVFPTLYVAVLVHRWKDTRRDAQELSIGQLVSRRFFDGVHANRRKEKENKTVKLDRKFWQQRSVLCHLGCLDESGRIVAKDPTKDTSRKASNGELASRGADGREQGEESIGPHNILAIFKKAHMEMASQLCRQIADRGSNMNGDNLSEEEENLPPEDEGEDAAAIEIGIVEEPVDEKTAASIIQRLATLLQEDEHPVEEIWLDVLIGVLEEIGCLTKLQHFFLPLRMRLPKKNQEWYASSCKKKLMERRLNTFLKWLKQEAKLKHYEFLKQSAAAKERVLKQQSLVLTDYLEQLDEQINKSKDEIEVLERKNNQMRTHVSPLL